MNASKKTGPKWDRLTEAQKQQFNDRIQELRRKYQAGKYKARATKSVKPITPPRYDDVYFEGLEWLNGG
jgi:hypothetical protein